MPIVRYLEWFDHETEAFVGRVDLAITLEELQELFGSPRENPMYDCAEIKPEHVEYLQVRTGQVLDLNRYAYYVSAEEA